MKSLYTIAIFILTLTNAISQENPVSQQVNKKGQFYFYWGWNLSAYSKSNIHFEGENYNFTLKKVVAKHRPTTLSVEKYLNPLNITIPQYNFRVGYFIKDNLNISFGADHMKYVVQQGQQVKISGHIDGTETGYDRVYSDDDVEITEGFLELEHTDGLNYLNIELRRLDNIFSRKNLSLNIVEGFGAGVIVPRTDATLLNERHHDEFNLAGYGVGAVVGLNVSIRKHFFIQTEFKTGFINLPWIRTTYSDTDNAKQHFFFYQANIVFGTTINSKKD